jgi:hypothetical protein
VGCTTDVALGTRSGFLTCDGVDGVDGLLTFLLCSGVVGTVLTGETLSRASRIMTPPCNVLNND